MIIIITEAVQAQSQGQRALVDVVAAVNRLYRHTFNSRWSVLVGRDVILRLCPEVEMLTLVSITDNHYRHNLRHPCRLQDGLSSINL